MVCQFYLSFQRTSFWLWLTSFLWLWFQCVCPLATPTVLLGFLLPWSWGISSWLLQQSAAAALYLGWGVSPHHRPSQPLMWNRSSRPSGARAVTAPWTWGHSSRPQPLSRAWGSSSWPLPLGRGVLLTSAPDLTSQPTFALMFFITFSFSLTHPRVKKLCCPLFQ